LHETGIKSLIQNRSCWPKDGEQEKTIGGRVPLHVVHDEAGSVYCYDTVSQLAAHPQQSLDLLNDPDSTSA
jgi:hypothetical protein